MSTRALTSRMADTDLHHNRWGPLVDAPTRAHGGPPTRLLSPPPPTKPRAPPLTPRHPAAALAMRARQEVGVRVLDVDARASPPGPKHVRDQDLPCHLTVLALLHEAEASDVAAGEWAMIPLYSTPSRAAKEAERVRNSRASSSIFLPSPLSHFVPSSLLSFAPALGEPYF
ncbi:hypothetical protein B0H19DRAFT_1277328 [Mycena capillaripes]|nr:hypothetical protein B0H19DRAFT_1277328 [Mycena capillaripes]